MLIAQLSCIFLAFLGCALASDVLVFDSTNFDTEIKKHDIILVEFYAPWCGHCKALAPKYEEAATSLKSNDPPIHLAKIDCDAEKDLCQRFNVGGYPTLKIFRNGEVGKDYEGPRDPASAIAKYMKKQAEPSSRELKSDKDLEKFLTKDEYSVLGCFAKQSKSYDTFQQVASAERDDYRFAITTDASIVKKYKCEDHVIVFQPKRLASKFEDAEVKLAISEDKKAIKDFLLTSTLGLCGIREQENAAKFPKPTIIAYFPIDYDKNPKGTNYWRNRVLKVASQFKNKLTFAVSNKETFSHEIDEFGLGDKKTAEKPIVTAFGPKGEKLPMNDEFSVESLKKFAEDVLAGKIEPFMKSEPIPEKNDEPVKVAVAKNFDALVNDPTKDALIEFYAPWCGHCKQLTPKYEELAKKLENEDEIVIAKMDATANDVPPSFDVKGFPTIYWVPKDKKSNPERYEGGREVKDFLKFIAEKSTNELKGYNRDGKKKKKDDKTEL